ncbi:hypothetical protein [Novosphingobium sp. ST904]|uniref:hypothetical protein n=1 Tax=Novosphingobium sp. ST904 TaxID=1684385 RepID=UPI0006C8BC67|nr:hypothetical protein [Novosphingobium sp. ST904]KPH62342.1 hypothetical protein ADT71_15530 [Novosphingobium sp. ST904]TCM43308.1 hypothetical protein EDF59_101412 [Novosphingobium sp. ST904]
MARCADGLKIANSIFEAAAWSYSIRLTCKCGHTAVFDPHALWWLFERRGWNGSFVQAKRRFYCSECKKQRSWRFTAITLETCSDPPTISLPMPDEPVWKRAINRFRG